MNAKRGIKSLLMNLIIPGIMIAVGLIWPSFYWLSIGIIITAIITIFTMFCLIKKRDFDDDNIVGNMGCSIMLIIAAFTLAYWIYNETRFISSKGYKQHIYADCSTFKSGSNIKEVCELEGFFYGCFPDCKLCKEREKEEMQMKRIQKERMRELEAQRERQYMISKLENAIEELNEGKSVSSVAESLSDYFLDEGYIKIEVEEDDGGYIRGIPSRYQ